MKKVSLDIWIQLLGMIGVLGGLVFVGLELQQSQRIAIASQIQARNDAIMAFFSAPLEGSTLAMELFQNGVSFDFDSLSEDERVVLSQITRVRVVSLQNAWQQYNLGLIPEDTFEFTKGRIMSLYDNCQSRPIVVGRASQGFLEFLEANSNTLCDFSIEYR